MKSIGEEVILFFWYRYPLLPNVPLPVRVIISSFLILHRGHQKQYLVAGLFTVLCRRDVFLASASSWLRGGGARGATLPSRGHLTRATMRGRVAIFLRQGVRLLGMTAPRHGWPGGLRRTRAALSSAHDAPCRPRHSLPPRAPRERPRCTPGKRARELAQAPIIAAVMLSAGARGRPSTGRSFLWAAARRCVPPGGLASLGATIIARRFPRALRGHDEGCGARSARDDPVAIIYPSRLFSAGPDVSWSAWRMFRGTSRRRLGRPGPCALPPAARALRRDPPRDRAPLQRFRP